ncbi:MAG: RluA family pseudouridine synthase [Candidatus Pacebacteria bacterium]|nr:RluA family pseudouridine synthase [Candidatus Paceibacterota bacterium]
MKIPILYEDKDVVVINKPAGLVVHPDGKTKEKTLVDWILTEYPRTKNVGEPTLLKDGTEIIRPGIVHRIDRETSGVLIIAKNKKSYEFLKEQFKERKAHKIYQAFVYGELKDERGMIDRPIGRSPSDFRKWSSTRGARGEMREAVTYFKVLKKKDDITFVEVMPKTGRTHQIRVHFSAINHPVVQDGLYASQFYLEKENQLGFKRTALHARQLEINIPSGKLIKIVAPYPKDFEEAIKEIEK